MKAVEKDNCVCLSGGKAENFPSKYFHVAYDRESQEKGTGETPGQLVQLSSGFWFHLVMVSDLYPQVFQRPSSDMSEWRVSTLYQDKTPVCLWAPQPDLAEFQWYWGPCDSCWEGNSELSLHDGQDILPTVLSDCKQKMSQEYPLKVLPVYVFLNVNSTLRTDFISFPFSAA